MAALVLGLCCLAAAASASAVIPAEDKTQNLKMTTTEVTEVCPGTLIDVKVAYETSNFDMTTAISFKLQWNKEVFEIVEKADTAKLNSCSLRYFDNQFHNEFEYISFLCASMTGQNVIPAKISKVMTATLRAKANLRPGHATVSLIANPGLPGSGFKYLASAPLTVDINPTCSPEQIASAKGAEAARASRDSVMGSVESEAGAASGPGGMQWQMALGAVGIIAVVVLMLSRRRTRSAGDIQYAPL